MMYTMPKNLLSICVNFTLATQQSALFQKKCLTVNLSHAILKAPMQVLFLRLFFVCLKS